jgi:hypothetical protein
MIGNTVKMPLSGISGWGFFMVQIKSQEINKPAAGGVAGRATSSTPAGAGSGLPVRVGLGQSITGRGCSLAWGLMKQLAAILRYACMGGLLRQRLFKAIGIGKVIHGPIGPAAAALCEAWSGAGPYRSVGNL